jgi:uncharacterized sporulation protein YeaH/YhbH (DUF444 family)
MTTEEARELAEKHWWWLESLLQKVYVDAMIHGIKHGEEATREDLLTIKVDSYE